MIPPEQMPMAGGLMMPPGAMADLGTTAKRTKAEVGYRAGEAGQTCGACAHFDGTNRCELVDGEISADMVCDLFEPGVLEGGGAEL